MTPDRYPLISVLIPNYNYVKYVATAVQSALDQTYPNLEVVVADNCSTDGAWELLSERFGSNPRVRLHRNERNIGMARNFDRLLELARGDFLLCLSSDDFLLPPHLERLEARFHADPSLDVVYCNAYFAHDDGVVYTKRAMPGEFPADYVDARDELVEQFTTVCPICFPCALFKRETLLEPGICGEPENGQDARDWEVMIRLALAGKRFAYIAQPSMGIRLHADQFSGDAYHRSGRNVLDFASYVERYMGHPEFVRRMRGRETGVARLLRLMVDQAPSFNEGVTPFDGAQLARFAALQEALNARAAVYEPARVRDAKISVVMPTNGAPAALTRALDSLIAQRWTDWEAVVVDYGMVDVAGLLRSHPVADRLSYLRLPSAPSAGAARNLALRMARGEYVAFLEPDNRFTEDHLSRGVDAIARSGALAALAASRVVFERADEAACNAEEIGHSGPFGDTQKDLDRLPVAHTVPLDALLVYRGVFERIGTFNDAVPFLEDWDFALRLAHAIGVVPTGAATVDITARLGLVAQRLGSALPRYLTVMDALYAAHPVDARLAEERARHRTELATVLAGGRDWLRDQRGLAAAIDSLAGRYGARVLSQPA